MIEVGKIYHVEEYCPFWEQTYVRVVTIFAGLVSVVDIKNGGVVNFDTGWLKPLPKELADFSEEELKFYLAL